ncbi:MAG: hypothetical protein R3F34_07600 [Planctomycetota bacterium]
MSDRARSSADVPERRRRSHVAAARAAHPARRGGVPGWLPLGVLAWGVAAGLGALDAQVDREAVTWIDPARVAVLTDATFVDPRWEDELTALLASFEPFASDDAEARANLAHELAALPFVAEVGDPRLLWPDGATLRLRFERPVACVRTDGVFHAVSDSGAVLPGAYAAPPERGGVSLPVIGRLGYDEDGLRPGAVLDREPLWHALSVVLSMERHLDADARAALGRVTIDAEQGEVGEVEVPGAVLYLEGRRAVLFGRTPDVDAPGELDEATKWRHVRDALQREARGELAWRAIDVRWDRYAVAARRDEAERAGPAPWRTPAQRAKDEGREPPSSHDADLAGTHGTVPLVAVPLAGPGASVNRGGASDVPRIR